VMWCWRLRLSLAASGGKLYRGPFTEVARVDLAKAATTDTGGHTGGLCPYRGSLNLLEASGL
jgi:hypothetical protein